MSDGTPIRVLIVDDHPVVRWGFRQMLSTDPQIEVVGEAASMRECLDAVMRHRPQVVLLDIRMPEADGIETARLVKQSHSGTRVLILTVFDDLIHIRAALEAGADGYLSKTVSCEALLAAIREVVHGRQVIAPDVVQQLLRELSLGGREVAAERPKLTDEERSLLRCLAGGASLAEVSATMHWSAATTGRRISQLCDKLGVRNRAQAIYEAARLGLV